MNYKWKWLNLFGVSLLAFTAYLDATIVNTAIPFIQNAFNCNILTLQWITNIFVIVLSMTMIAVGKVADRFGKSRIFYLGIMIFAVAAMGAGLSNSIYMLIFFRAIQALGASTVFITSSALLSEIFPAKERIRAISFFGAMTGFGLMIGPFIGGVLIQLLSWRWVFWINIPLIVCGLLCCMFTLTSRSDEHKTKIDRLGLSLLIFGLGSFMYGLISLPDSQWKSITAWACLTAGIASLTTLIVIDEKKKNPLLDLHIFKYRIISLSALSCAMAGVASTVFMFFDPLYLKKLKSLSPFLIGLMTATIPTAQAIIASILNKIVKSFGIAKLLLFSVVIACAAVFLHRFFQESTSLIFLLLPFFLLGINWGISNSVMITAVNTEIASHEISAAIGTIATIWNISGALILALSAVIFHTVNTTKPFLAAYHSVINFNIAFSVAILIISLFIYVKHLKIKKLKN